MKRRQVLGQILGSIGAGAVGFASGPLLAKGRQRWGVQAFTVLAALEKDFGGTLKALAGMGYREVETIGSFGRDPHEVKRMLDRLGLVSPSQHISPDEVYASFSAWTRREITTETNRANYLAGFTIERSAGIVADAIVKAKALGQRYVVWPILLEQHISSRAVLDGYLRVFNEAGAACAKAGLYFAFHNHAREFAKLGNDVIYDLILANTDPALVKMEMDFYWMAAAKADPYAYLAGNKGRYFGAHVKDMDAKGDFTVVGTGVLDLDRQIKAARAAGVGHFYVEYDRADDPMLAVRKSMGWLSGR